MESGCRLFQDKVPIALLTFSLFPSSTPPQLNSSPFSSYSPLCVSLFLSPSLFVLHILSLSPLFDMNNSHKDSETRHPLQTLLPPASKRWSQYGGSMRGSNKTVLITPAAAALPLGGRIRVGGSRALVCVWWGGSILTVVFDRGARRKAEQDHMSQCRTSLI